jgi:hypothetical protein
MVYWIFSCLITCEKKRNGFKIEQGKISRTFWKPFEDEKNMIHQLMKANKTNL